MRIVESVLYLWCDEGVEPRAWDAGPAILKLDYAAGQKVGGELEFAMRPWIVLLHGLERCPALW